MRIALIAHDNMKEEMISFVKNHIDFFRLNELFATGTTGSLITEGTDLQVYRFLSGPLGGDQQIGSKIACSQIDIVIFFRDPLTSQPHEPDITALIRLCDVHKVPVATNHGTAELIIKYLKQVTE